MIRVKQTDSRWIFKVYEGDVYYGEMRVARFSTHEDIMGAAKSHVSLHKTARKIK